MAEKYGTLKREEIEREREAALVACRLLGHDMMPLRWGDSEYRYCQQCQLSMKVPVE